jgi:hypothetical protein
MTRPIAIEGYKLDKRVPCYTHLPVNLRLHKQGKSV